MMFASVVGASDFAEPSDVRVTDGASLEIAGMTFTAERTGSHPGSTAFRIMDTGAEPLMLSGDLLFAGSIGRTDLPGGDTAAMLDSLARVVLPQPDDMLVLPGHGETTTIGAERRVNPFLQGLAAPGTPGGRP